jgi:hypothetical protein
MTAIGQPYIGLSNHLQAFYVRRGMWADGKPRGLLATWLGEPVPWTVPYAVHGCVAYWTTHEGLAAMRDDAIAAPPQAWRTYHQRAQFLRRLREAGERAGAPVGQPQPKPPRFGQVAPPAAPGEPFATLAVPPEGTKARAAFERHVMRTLREFVDYTQGTAYTEESAP